MFVTLAHIRKIVTAFMLGILFGMPCPAQDVPRVRDRGRLVRTDYARSTYQLDHLLEVLKRGRPVQKHTAAWLDKHLKTTLLRAEDMNRMDEAHYAVAEIRLAQGQHDACLARLSKVLDEAGRKENETVWVTRLNRANVCRVPLGDIQQAIREYRLVKGRFAPLAQHLLVRTLEEADRLEDAVAILKEDYGAAPTPGKKLAMLWRVADFYDRITREFSREQLEALAFAERISEDKASLREQADKILEGRDQGGFDRADRDEKQLLRATRRRIAALRAGGHDQEADALAEALKTARKRLEPGEPPRDAARPKP